jgi:hypothetical protein
MKMPTAILLTSSPKGFGAGDPTIGGPGRAAAQPGPFLSERTHDTESR